MKRGLSDRKEEGVTLEEKNVPRARRLMGFRSIDLARSRNVVVLVTWIDCWTAVFRILTYHIRSCQTFLKEYKVSILYLEIDILRCSMSVYLAHDLTCTSDIASVQ